MSIVQFYDPFKLEMILNAIICVCHKNIVQLRDVKNAHGVQIQMVSLIRDASVSLICITIVNHKIGVN